MRSKSIIILYRKANGKCFHCGIQTVLECDSLAVAPTNYATKDHIIPVSKGGWGLKFNKVLSCLSCNQKRGNASIVDHIDEAAIWRKNIGI